MTERRRAPRRSRTVIGARTASTRNLTRLRSPAALPGSFVLLGSSGASDRVRRKNRFADRFGEPVTLLERVRILIPVDDPSAAGDRIEAETFLSALVRGAPWAAEEAWHRFSPMVNRLLRRGLGPTADLDDVMQEVFLSFFRRVNTLRDALALRSFVFSIAVRVMRWQLRRRMLRRIVGLSSTGDLPDIVEPPLDIEAREALRRVYALFDKFRPLDRTIFVLRQADEMSLPEIAAAVDVSLSTVKRRFSRTRGRMRRLIEADPLLSVYFDAQELGMGTGMGSGAGGGKLEDHD